MTLFFDKSHMLLVLLIFFSLLAPRGVIGEEPAEPSEWFRSGYGALSPIMGVQTFGKWRLEYEDTGSVLERGDLRGGPMVGGRFVGYKSLRRGHFQIGASVSYLSGFSGGWKRTLGDGIEEWTTLRQFLFAVSLKGGTVVTRCFWLGAGLDFGPLVHVTQSWEAETYAETDVTSDADMGVHFYPYVSADLLLVDRGSLKFGLTLNAGIYLIPGIADIESSLTNERTIQRYVTPIVSLGLMLGA